jgi:D-glycero-D-manno-heptose 1,7-bisphosphate phosphatase
MPDISSFQSQKAVFLDRDGTLIVEKHYIKNPQDVELEFGVVEGLNLLKNNGYLLIMVTNQSGIGRGLLTLADFEAVQTKFFELLAEQGLNLDAVYMCPHHPNDACSCRKPKPGLILQGISDFHLDPKVCFMIGDKESDCEAGKAAGTQSILLQTETAPNFLEAVKHITLTPGPSLF